MTDVITQHLDVWTSSIASKASAGRGTSDKQTAYGIKKLRELIFELAVRGKLVSQDQNDEPAFVLLEKIETEKKRLINESGIKKQNPSSEVNKDDTPFNVPPNWKWARLSEITQRIHYGYTASANESITDVRLLRITDIQDNNVDWASVPGCDISEKDIQQFGLKNGDILVASVTSPTNTY